MSSLMVHEKISSLQLLGFTVQVCCVMAWTSVKQYGQLFPKDPRPSWGPTLSYGHREPQWWDGSCRLVDPPGTLVGGHLCMLEGFKVRASKAS